MRIQPVEHGVTYIHAINGQTFMKLAGWVALPLGATIELREGFNANVVGVRLLYADQGSSMNLCLDVEVPEGFWSLPPEKD